MIVILCFLLSIIVAFRFNAAKNGVEVVLVTSLGFSAFIVGITEMLSLFTALNFFAVAIVWGVATLLLFGLLFYKRQETKHCFFLMKLGFVAWLKSLSIFKRLLLFAVVSCLGFLFYQGIIYPPNDWDSLIYHMSRIMFWLGNGSLMHFPVHNLRDLYQPPLAEFFIMHINLMNGNDYFSFFVQWLFLALSLVSIYGLLRFLKVSRDLKFVAMLLAVTIPSAFLQATTAKNDVVCGFFILTSIYFSFKAYEELTLKSFIILGLAVGLGILTKATVYLFLGPTLILLVIFILLKLFKKRQYAPLKYGFVAIFVILVLNLGHYSRNYKINGSLINIDDVESKSFFNSHMNGELLISSLVKNASIHLGYPIHGISDESIRKFHDKIGVDIDDPKNNYQGGKYENAKELTTHEDYVPNIIHFTLLLISFFVVAYHVVRNYKENKMPLLMGVILALQILLFAACLKWQPWHTRLHVPMFFLGSAFTIVAAHLSKIFRYVVFASIPLLLYSFSFYFLYNNIRPIIKNREYTYNISPSDSRFKKYFANQPQLYVEYSEVVQNIYDAEKSRKIGLNLYNWDYPLVYDFYYDQVKLEAIFVSNNTNKIPQDENNIDIIISDGIKKDFILFGGRKYVNRTPDHLYIWFYN